MRFIVDTNVLIYTAFLIMVVPFRLFMAWLLAILIHEFGHYIALRVFGITIYSIEIKLLSVLMRTEPIEGWKEAICAAAGPMAGLCLLLFARFLPCTAIFAFLHSIYNLLPFFPLDGGRIVKGIKNELMKIPLKTSQTNSTIAKNNILEK